MNTDDRLLQILDNSACLSKGQLTGYIKHTLYPEELRAVELHLSSCSLCNDALEGLEMQQDIDNLIASMTPPVLPALAPKEKPKEKKEVPVAAPKPEKKEAAAGQTRTSIPLSPAADKKTEQPANVFHPKKRWGRPIGIAAGLLLIFGTLWYWDYNRDLSKNEIAAKMDASQSTVPSGKLRPSSAPAQTITPGVDSSVLLAEKKHTDSIYLAKREELRQKTKRDSMMALAARSDTARTGRSAATESPAIAANRIAEVRETEQAEPVKKVAAAPAMAKAKEDAKKEPTDFELGMRKFKEKNYASALLYFKSAESDKDDPKHWEAIYYSGLCNRNLNKDRKARKMFERIVEAGAPQKKSAQKQLDDMKKGD